MKKCSKQKPSECNEKDLEKCVVVMKVLVRLKSECPESINNICNLYNTENRVLNVLEINKFYVSNSARLILFFPQILGKTCLITAGEIRVSWQIAKVNNNKLKERNNPDKIIFKKPKTVKLSIYNESCVETKFASSVFQYKEAQAHDGSNEILLSGDVELNPGPPVDGSTGNKNNHIKGKKNRKTQMELITYNCRGLKEYKKLKRLLNTCANITASNKMSIIFLQETHLDQEVERKLTLMWRGNFVLSPGEGGSRGCLSLFDKFRKRTSSIFGNPATQYLATPQSLN